jgi:hypothetical protein
MSLMSAAEKPQTDSGVIPAEAAGLRRLFKQHHEANYARMERIFASPAVQRAGVEFGRGDIRRSSEVLERCFAPVAVLQAKRLERRKRWRSIMVWRLIHARELTPWIDPPDGSPPEAEVTPDLAQGVVQTYYLMAQADPRIGICGGSYGFTIADHALGRFYERHPRGDLESEIWQSFANILAIPERITPALVAEQECFVSTITGAFRCQAILATSAETGMDILSFRAASWFSSDDIRPGLMERWERSTALMARQGEEQIIAGSLLHPLHLRRRK